jgi:hypothetical protein
VFRLFIVIATPGNRLVDHHCLGVDDGPIRRRQPAGSTSGSAGAYISHSNQICPRLSLVEFDRRNIQFRPYHSIVAFVAAYHQFSTQYHASRKTGWPEDSVFLFVKKPRRYWTGLNAVARHAFICKLFVQETAHSPALALASKDARQAGKYSSQQGSFKIAFYS